MGAPCTFLGPPSYGMVPPAMVWHLVPRFPQKRRIQHILDFGPWRHQTARVVVTPWKLNSSPLNIYRAPKGEDRLPTIMAFRGYVTGG